MIEIVGLHHVQITVRPGDERAAREFYCGLLGLREIEKPVSLSGRGGFWLQVGEAQVHVGTEEDVDRRRTKAHLAYRVRDIAASRTELHRHGVDIEDSIPIPRFSRFEIHDPFGNRIELIQPLGF